MQPATFEITDDRRTIRDARRHADGLVIDWFDGHSSFFHALWLRDCCYCETCGDSYSSKRFVVPSEIPFDIEIGDIEIVPNDLLTIRWLQDGHVSRYDSLWLRRHCYDDASRAARFHSPLTWDAKISGSIPTVSFADAQCDELRRLDLYRKLRDFGFVVVGNGPAGPGGIEAVAALIGDLGDSAYSKIFDLTPGSRIRTMGNTQKSVPPHTDEAFRYSPPGINILGCLRPASDGGDTLLVDGFQVAARLRNDNRAMFELLCRHQQTFNRIHAQTLDQRCRQRVIERDDRGEVIGIRFHTRSAGPLDLPVELMKPYYEAQREFCRLTMSAENQIRFRLQAGESVIFDNHRVLHARTGFGDSQRHLQICNVARESFHQRLRLLAEKLGYAGEAGMVLAAGVC